MKSYTGTLTFSTREKYQLVDITSQVEEAVLQSHITTGYCLVYVPHATAAIIVNEHENGLMHDILEKVKELFPSSKGYLHDRIDDNASGHIASALIGASRSFPIDRGRLVRGTWQNVFLLELDGPRSRRTVLVHVLGE
jgi:secondary thiamine-phosphate synthase enzyme